MLRRRAIAHNCRVEKHINGAAVGQVWQLRPSAAVEGGGGFKNEARLGALCIFKVAWRPKNSHAYKNDTISKIPMTKSSLSDPLHIEVDPDPRIRFREYGSGSDLKSNKFQFFSVKGIKLIMMFFLLL